MRHILYSCCRSLKVHTFLAGLDAQKQSDPRDGDTADVDALDTEQGIGPRPPPTARAGNSVVPMRHE